LIISSPAYFIKPNAVKKLSGEFTLEAQNSLDNGSIGIFISSNNNRTIKGYYKLYRKKDGTDFWEKIEELTLDFDLNANKKLIYLDRTVE